MTDYDDQNSSEYKDQTTETAPAEQTGQQISSPADGQDTNQQSPDNRQMPPQNNGQDPYWQNPNNQQIPPQNNGQNPYWQNPNNQQMSPQHLTIMKFFPSLLTILSKVSVTDPIKNLI